MSNQSPCTDPLYPCTALTLAEKSYALDGLTWLRKHMLAVNFRELEAVDAAICALRKAATADDCRVRKIPVYGMGQAKDAAYSQRGDDYLLEAQRIVDDIRRMRRICRRIRRRRWRMPRIRRKCR